MRILTLTNSKIPVLVDDEDYEHLSEFNWQFSTQKGYVARSVWKSGRNDTEYLHRVIMDAPKGMDVDHKDMNRFNNQKANLRICTRSENMANSPPRPGLSKYKGVSYLKHAGKWLAYIKYDYKQIHIGYTNDEREAAHFYNQFAEQLFGDFAYLNDIK